MIGLIGIFVFIFLCCCFYSFISIISYYIYNALNNTSSTNTSSTPATTNSAPSSSTGAYVAPGSQTEETNPPYCTFSGSLSGITSKNTNSTNYCTCSPPGGYSDTMGNKYQSYICNLAASQSTGSPCNCFNLPIAGYQLE